MQIEFFPDDKTLQELLSKSETFPLVGKIRLTAKNRPTEFFERIYGSNPKNCFLFESNSYNPKTAQNSYFGKIDSNKIYSLSYTSKKSTEEFAEEVKSLFQNLSQKTEKFDYAPFFWSGEIVLASYGIVRAFEKIPFTKPDFTNFPEITLAKTSEVFCLDEKTQELSFSLSVSNSDDLKKAKAKIETTFSKLSKEMESENEEFFVSKPKSNFPKSEYEKVVEKIKKYIFEGDVYQVNISQKFSAKFSGNAFSLFKKLNSINPSPFANFVNFDEFTVVSSSPERLLKVENGFAETRPIGGTRKRGESEIEDSDLAEELLLNEKERAEHTMLVDLERNDLGRICEYGTVEVDEFMVIENYSHVKHIVSNVSGKLFPNLSLFDLLRAMFPGGTLTGCPKVRCMEIIEELETCQRGLYAGSVGFVNCDGNLDLNIVIRTFVINEENLEFQVGGGIVADSEPEKEYFESLQKAKALLKTLGLEKV
ncbi:MAG: anthranilate synthase component I family protein [Calditrichaeota bacterium]|nr:MAG: anthranilate synthase component I family protein [Calditrichota bacterium]